MTAVDEIKRILENNKSYLAYKKCIKEQFPEIDKALENSGYKYAEALYLFVNNMSSRPTCKHCAAELKYIDRTVGYGVYCSHRCYIAAGAGVDARTQTNLEKYGSKNPLGNQEIRAKRKHTMIEKYGSEFPLQNGDLKNKATTTYKNNYTDLVSEKRKDTIKERYGVDNVWEIPGFREKIEKTNLERYGVKYGLASPEIINKVSTTRLHSFYDILKNRFQDVSLITDKDNYVGINKFNGGDSYMWKCNKCNNIFEDYVRYGYMPVCRMCYPGKMTRGEISIKEFLEENNISFVLKDRTIIKPKELDFYIPEFNLAIEYCGLYWHSELKVDKNYHREKYQQCLEKGIRLVTIFEDEWIQRPDVCKNRLLNMLGKSGRLCGARQTKVKPISGSDARNFLESTHIQGYVNSSVNLGLFFGDTLVSVMTFGKGRRLLNNREDNNSSYELLRFATTANIPGAASKLLSYFVRTHNPAKIISYCDLRWGTGAVYEKLGMTLVGETQPGYWYSKDGVKRYHRSSFTKKSLMEKGLKGKTEWEIMSSLGYYKIWDCGNKKYQLIFRF